MPKKEKFIECAGTIVFRMNESGKYEFLLVRPTIGPTTFGIPKGHREPNELIAECAVRETWEEVGIVARLLTEMPPIFTKTPKENKIVYSYLAKQLNEGAPLKLQANEIAEAKWFDIDNLPEIHQYQQPLIKNAVATIKRNLKA